MSILDGQNWTAPSSPPQPENDPVLLRLDLPVREDGHGDLPDTTLAWNDATRQLTIHLGPPAPSAWTAAHPLAQGVHAILAGPHALAAFTICLPADPRPAWHRLRLP